MDWRLEHHGVGPKAVGEIRRALAEKGMMFADGRRSENG